MKKEMSKHTPGPWYWAPKADGAVFIKSDDTRPLHKTVAQVASNELSAMEANARLIAAAPELLEALRDVTEYLENNRVTAREAALLRSATAAIDKAEG